MRTFESRTHYNGKFVEVTVEFEPYPGIRRSLDPQEQEGTSLVAVWMGKEDILAELNPHEVMALENEADDFWADIMYEEIAAAAEARMEMHLDR